MYQRLFALFMLLMAGATQAGAQSPAPSNDYVFPLFVDGTTSGGNYRSVLRITSAKPSTPMQCKLNQRNTSASFTGVNGDFYTADVIDAGFSPLALTLVNLDSFLPFEILRTGAQSSLKTGYAKLSCPGAVQTQLQFSLSDAKNNKLGEAAISPATQGNSFQFLVDRRDGTRLGFSLVDDSAVGGQYAVIARDQFNNVIDQNFDFIEPFSQVSRFADEMLVLPSNFVGSIEIVGVPGGNNYVTGLQFTGPVFSTATPIVRSTPIGL